MMECRSSRAHWVTFTLLLIVKAVKGMHVFWGTGRGQEGNTVEYGFLVGSVGKKYS